MITAMEEEKFRARETGHKKAETKSELNKRSQRQMWLSKKKEPFKNEMEICCSTVFSKSMLWLFNEWSITLYFTAITSFRCSSGNKWLKHCFFFFIVRTESSTQFQLKLKIRNQFSGIKMNDNPLAEKAMNNSSILIHFHFPLPKECGCVDDFSAVTNYSLLVSGHLLFTLDSSTRNDWKSFYESH